MALAAVALAATGWLAGCGGDSDDVDDDDGPVATTPIATEPDAGGDADGESGVGGGTASAAPGDLVSEIMIPLFGFTVTDLGFSEADQACMNDELAAEFPDGLPEDIASSEDVAGALDAAAEACDVSLR